MPSPGSDCESWIADGIGKNVMSWTDRVLDAAGLGRGDRRVEFLGGYIGDLHALYPTERPAALSEYLETLVAWPRDLRINDI